MATPHLQVPDIQANQNQKSVTANEAHALLDRAMNQLVEKVITVSAEFTTTETRQNAVIKLTGTPGAPFTVDMPDTNERLLTVYNDTDGIATIRNSVGAGADQPVIEAGDVTTFHYDGVDFTPAGGGGGSVENFVDLGDVPAAYTGASAFRVKVTAGEDGLEFVDDVFTELNDTPSSYTGNAGAIVQVNGTEDGLEFGGVPGVVGAMGPWEWLSTTPLSGATETITALGTEDYLALMVVIQGAEIDTDLRSVFLQITTGGVLRTTTYSGAGTSQASNDATQVTEGNTALTAFNFTAPLAGWTLGNAANETLNGVMIIHNPFSATRRKSFTRHSVYTNGDGNRIHSVGAGIYEGTGATDPIEALTIALNDTGNFDAGDVHVYGLRGSNPLMPIDVFSFTPGVPSDSQICLRYVAAREILFADDFASSQASAEVAATASAEFDILVNGVSVGALTFAMAADVGTFATDAGTVTLVAGDVLMVTGPADNDATLADISITFAGSSAFV